MTHIRARDGDIDRRGVHRTLKLDAVILEDHTIAIKLDHEPEVGAELGSNVLHKVITGRNDRCRVRRNQVEVQKVNGHRLVAQVRHTGFGGDHRLHHSVLLGVCAGSQLGRVPDGWRQRRVFWPLEQTDRTRIFDDGVGFYWRRGNTIDREVCVIIQRKRYVALARKLVPHDCLDLFHVVVLVKCNLLGSTCPWLCMSSPFGVGSGNRSVDEVCCVSTSIDTILPSIRRCVKLVVCFRSQILRHVHPTNPQLKLGRLDMRRTNNANLVEHRGPRLDRHRSLHIHVLEIKFISGGNRFGAAWNIEDRSRDTGYFTKVTRKGNMGVELGIGTYITDKHLVAVLAVCGSHTQICREFGGKVMRGIGFTCGE